MNRMEDGINAYLAGDVNSAIRLLTAHLNDWNANNMTYQWNGRIYHCGVENMTLVSDYDKRYPKDEDHCWTGISIENAENCWVQKVNFRHFAGSAVVRIPAYAKLPSRRRFELRNPDATCNPYYAYAAILMAGLDGLKKKTEPSACGWGPFDFNLFDLPEAEKAKLKAIPRDLGEALDALEADHDYLTAGGVFPESLVNTWLSRKRRELYEFNKIPHPAEFLRYYHL